MGRHPSTVSWRNSEGANLWWPFLLETGSYKVETAGACFSVVRIKADFCLLHKRVKKEFKAVVYLDFFAQTY